MPPGEWHEREQGRPFMDYIAKVVRMHVFFFPLFYLYQTSNKKTKKQNKPKKITSRTFLVATKLSLSMVIVLRTRRGDVQFLVSSLLHKSSNSSSHTLDLLYSILSNGPEASFSPPKDAAARQRESRARRKYNKYY